MRVSPKGKWSIRRFRRKEEGAVTVEAALWVPFFLILMFGIGEISLVFYGQAQTLLVAEKANRAYAIGQFSAQEAEDWAVAALSKFTSKATATVSTKDLMVSTTITVPAGAFSGNIGIFSMFTGARIKVTAQQTMEF